MLDNAELQQMRDDLADLLPDTGNILSVTRVPDGQGGYTDTWGTATASIACRIDASASRGVSNFQGSEVLTGGAIHPFGRWTCTLPYNAQITTENRFECNGRTFNVVALDTNKSWQANVRVILEQV